MRISRHITYLAIISNSQYDLNWYITTGSLPFEEFSKEAPWTAEVEWWAHISDKRLSLGKDEEQDWVVWIGGCI